MAEQIIVMMGIWDDETQKVLSGWYDELSKAGFKGKQTPDLLYHISLSTYTTDKEERNRIVIKIYEEDKTKGYKKIAKLYKEYTGRHVSSNTVKNILINQTDKCRINWIAEVCKDL